MGVKEGCGSQDGGPDMMEDYEPPVENEDFEKPF